MAFLRGKGNMGKSKSSKKQFRPKTARPNLEKGNTASYVLMKIEQCISVCHTASNVKIVADKLFEASKYIAELEKLEHSGLYKGTPHAKDYVRSFVNRKDKLLMDAIKRALASGESKEKILESQKFFTDEMKEFINHFE